MGYQTNYSLAASDPQVLKDFMTRIENEEEYAENFSILQDYSDGTYGAEFKWYEHEVEVAELSAKHPTVLFTLNGQGEESGDVWRKYFLGGQVQYAEMSFESFDSSKLVKAKKTY